MSDEQSAESAENKTPGVATEPALKPASSRRGHTLFRRAAQVALGLGFGLAMTEGAFGYRDLGAFPHLNVYVPDDKLGVRLRPGAAQKISFGGNPVTHVRINARGYRGTDWPAPASDEVFIVGDSQVFGLGVEETQTFSAELARVVKRPVVNAGVPTYRPLEFNAVVAELVREPRARSTIRQHACA